MILIVDDKAENLFSLKKILELNQFEAETAQSGEEALKKILKRDYHLIILDVQMPGMDGFEVAETISGFGKSKDIPILFLSAVNTDKKFITRGYASGAVDYITKPVDPDILLLKVKTFTKLYQQHLDLNRVQLELREEIENRKQAQNELDERNAQLRSILQSIPQIAFTATNNGELEFVNSEWLLYAKDAKHFPETAPGDLPLETIWTNIISKNEPYSCELKISVLHQQNYRHHLLKVIPIREDGRISKWVGTFTDIHEQKLANEILEQKVEERTRALKKANEELESSNVDLQQFASVTSHDLKEPLRKIQVYSTIIETKLANDASNDLNHYISRILHSSKRMYQLINDLLNYSRLSVKSEYVPTDVNVLIDEILEDLELSIDEKKAAIEVALFPQIEVVPAQITQLFQNMISNSLKFSKKDVSPYITIRAELVSDLAIDAAKDVDGAYCRVIISDNGIGFDEEYIDKIFTIFQRLNNREDYEGTGIGLAIAKKIVEKHNGLITARSDGENGATFIIILPLHQKPEFVTEDQPEQVL